VDVKDFILKNKECGVPERMREALEKKRT